MERHHPVRQDRCSARTPPRREDRTGGGPAHDPLQPNDPRAADWPCRVIDQARLGPTSEAHHQQRRRPVLTPLLLPGHGATPSRPRQDRKAPRIARTIGTPAAPLSRSAHPSFPQNDIYAFPRCGQLEPPHLANPPASHRTVSFDRNDQQARSSRTPTDRSAYSSATSPGGLRFASRTLVHTGRPDERADQLVSARHQRVIPPPRRSAFHPSCHCDATLNAQACEGQLHEAFGIATDEGALHRSDCNVLGQTA